jgi:hypothetical protein
MKLLSLFSLLLLLAVGSSGFQPVSPAGRPLAGGTATTGAPTTPLPVARSFGTTALAALKKDKKDAKSEKSAQKWDVGLLLVYMTPWKNPNSVFVYLFAALYILGSISEARHH